ncbi:MAG TPA: class I SAM-dependent methyltransferase [Steroidobacteraceae bacterium]|nr:class I SAM-dependent methyltransferase [Steroidobacteraceae bacterium]
MATPHPVLTNYYPDEAHRRDYLRDLFDRTAEDYDRVERMMGFGSGPWYRRRALVRAGLASGMSVLDIGTGTGLVARQAAFIVGDSALVTGVDPSAGMIDHAKVPRGVRLIAGRAETIPVADASADFLSMGYALRHISDLLIAFHEFHRVLKPGGRLCLLEITRPERALGRAMLRAYMRGWVPLLSRVIARQSATPELMRYYWDTIEACTAPGVILGSLSVAGFQQVHRHVELGIFSEYRARKS